MIDYELIDCGNFEKLERFGPIYLIRPETQAIWNKQLLQTEWNKLAHARFSREAPKRSFRNTGNAQAGWTVIKKIPIDWNITCPLPDGDFTLKLSPTSYGHIGVFPEQKDNWQYIYRKIKQLPKTEKNILNLFAYTGGASLAARKAGANLTHVDALKSMISWGQENMHRSGLQDIRWIVDDALKFMRREIKRGNTYQGIIMDPPAFGRGPGGEIWILDETILELMETSSRLLDKENYFVVLNLYAHGYTPLTAYNLSKIHYEKSKIEFGETSLISQSGIYLPLGVYARSSNF